MGALAPVGCCPRRSGPIDEGRHGTIGGANLLEPALGAMAIVAGLCSGDRLPDACLLEGALIAAWRALEVTSWGDVEELLVKALRPGSGLLKGRMRAIWDELEVEL